ncbi:hypothetical protein A3J91_03425 [Candidatus Peribacteria bacterium RIFOXYC2_FULL_58_10]|nr:MAG: hypothetical protein A3J91_03425 [Candidatus Peribacteria bacterium RIFOXYC2_FULL_58_10]
MKRNRMGRDPPPRGVKGKALLPKAALPTRRPRILGGVDEEAQGRAEGLWRRSAFFASFFVALTKKEGGQLY